MEIPLSYLTAFLGTILLLWILRRLGARIGLLDYPGNHREHEAPTPLVGGLAMFCGFLFAVLTLDLPLSTLRSFFAGSALLVVVGVLDDFHELPPWMRFTAQIGAALLMAYWGGVILTDWGALVFDQLVILGFWSVPITVFSTVGVINALNMSDGIDGLAGGLSLIAFMLLAVIALNAGRTDAFDVLLLLGIVVIAFLLFNIRFSARPRALLFMGDAGSMFLGFALTWFLVSLSQEQERAMTPVTALWLLAIPLFDTVAIMLRRMLRGLSPFQADRQHLHHILQAVGLSVNQTLIVILAAGSVLGIIGVWGLYAGIPERIMFFSYLALFSIFFLAMTYGWIAIEKSGRLPELTTERRVWPGLLRARREPQAWKGIDRRTIMDRRTGRRRTLLDRRRGPKDRQA